MYDGDGWMWDGGGWGGWIVMAIVMVLFLTAVIAAVALAIRYLGSSPPSEQPGYGLSRAEEVLAERFARGEVDEEEYRRRMAALREHR
ncbi:SHOCT domain-containing protein [Mycobacterium sp. SM1]|uniref:SHOCT domain-containing protein n=1 Tax=Mycobacterium sp. SM1 TaxID=2816243 RepID=UPI001BCFB25F|nr:SHOCT domain-containing protein [Mycobacterium sp. SM1]MBS4727911.1 SHOCT domain-containing protein [Mycobacterium sp. SM1]